MFRAACLAFALVVMPFVTPPAGAPPTSQPGELRPVDFKKLFGEYEGCLVLMELRGEGIVRHDAERCEKRFSPCSTFKIFNALVGLETGVLSGGEDLRKWDRTKQHFKGWERDHTLATAMRDSVVWYFRDVAKKVGQERMQQYVQTCQYGNQDISGGITNFWLDGTMKISAEEQVAFLEKLYTGRLPFKPSNVELVKRLIVQKSGPEWVFSGKTGTAFSDGKYRLGWFVGHVKKGPKEYVFAVNISGGSDCQGQTAKRIALAALEEMGLGP